MGREARAVAGDAGDGVARPARRLASVSVLTRGILWSTAWSVAAVAFTWPLAAAPRSTVVGSSMLLTDVLLVTWILAWGSHALVTDPVRLFDANVLHPWPASLAGSEHLLGLQPVFMPVYLTTNDAVLAYNLTVLASFVLAAALMQLLIVRWTGSQLAACVAAVLFAFAPWRIDLGRPHLLQVQYFPLVLLLVDRATSDRRLRWAIGAAAAVTVQCLCSYYVGYAVYVLVGAYLAADVFVRGWRGRPVVRTAAVVLLGPLLVLGPASLPYLRLHRGADHLPYAIAPSDARLYLGALRSQVSASVAVAGALGALVVLRRRGHLALWRTRVIALILAAAGAAVLAIGPGWFEPFDPYAILFRFVPGFSSLRSPIRFATVSAFAVCACTGLGLAVLLSTTRSAAVRWGASIAALAWALYGSHAPAALGAFAIPGRESAPPVYRWLAEHGEGGPLLELPIGPPRGVNDDRNAAWAMYYSTLHWLPLLNGYTGYFPPGYDLVANFAAQLPGPAALDLLRRCTGVRWILLHAATRSDRAAFAAAGMRERVAFPLEQSLGPETVVFEVPATPVRGACPPEFAGGESGRPSSTPAAPPHGMIELDGVPAQVVAGTSVVLTLRLTNDSPVAWLGPVADGSRRIVAAVRWVDGSPPAKDRGAALLFLPQDVPAGSTLATAVTARAPGRPGRYLLDVRLRRLEEEDAGAPSSTRPVEVLAPRWGPGGASAGGAAPMP